jgi:hypothetical protein
MDFRHLTYFIAVAERLSFSKAAEELHVARPHQPADPGAGKRTGRAVI